MKNKLKSIEKYIIISVLILICGFMVYMFLDSAEKVPERAMFVSMYFLY